MGNVGVRVRQEQVWELHDKQVLGFEALRLGFGLKRALFSSFSLSLCPCNLGQRERERERERERDVLEGIAGEGDGSSKDAGLTGTKLKVNRSQNPEP
jgi:hypothetical protein